MTEVHDEELILTWGDIFDTESLLDKFLLFFLELGAEEEGAAFLKICNRDGIFLEKQGEIRHTRHHSQDIIEKKMLRKFINK